jgi:hypothetical protein
MLRAMLRAANRIAVAACLPARLMIMLFDGSHPFQARWHWQSEYYCFCFSTRVLVSHEANKLHVVSCVELYKWQLNVFVLAPAAPTASSGPALLSDSMRGLQLKESGRRPAL